MLPINVCIPHIFCLSFRHILMGCQAISQDYVCKNSLRFYNFQLEILSEDGNSYIFLTLKRAARRECVYTNPWFSEYVQKVFFLLLLECPCKKYSQLCSLLTNESPKRDRQGKKRTAMLSLLQPTYVYLIYKKGLNSFSFCFCCCLPGFLNLTGCFCRNKLAK